MKFKFLDRLISANLGGQASVLTDVTFSRSEDYLESPFHEPLKVPSSIILEAMAASGGRLIEVVSDHKVVGLMVKVDEASFMGSVSAGDTMVVHSELLGMQDRNGVKVGLARTRSQALVADKAVAEARIAFLCLPLKK